MNKVNFNKLRNISVPDEWIENAIKVPETIGQKKGPFSAGFKRFVTVIAAALLVCVMSIPLYVFEENKVSFPKKPTEYIGASDNGGLPSKTPTEITVGLNGTFPVSKTEIPHTEFESVSSAAETQGNTEVVTETKPFVAITNLHEPTSFEPTKPEPTNPYPTNSEPITNPSKTDPTEPSTGHYVSMIPVCAGAYDASDVVNADGVEEIYCCLYDSRGNLVGDTNLYSSEHIANATYMQNGYVFLSYEPTEKGLKLKVGTYKFYFYLSDWEVVYEGEIKVY